LKAHKYSGTDKGIAYVYFYDPAARYLVELLPETVAPNTLTMIGFMHTVVPIVLLYSCVGMSLTGEVPRWFIFL
jgi:hypothetical protein